MTHASRRALAVAIAAASASLTAVADDTPRLDNIVVTAAGFEQALADAPASISVVTREELERKRFSNVAEAIADVPGVDVRSGTGKTGGLNIGIRGMPSAYTLILVDGRRQNAAGDVTPNGFGETSTSFMPPLSSIERIEVIRGPMSTLYGSDAMGGVINIITRQVSDSWTGNLSVDSTFQQDRSAGNSQTLNLYTSGPLIEDTLGLQLRGRLFDRDSSERLIEDGSGRDPRPSEGRITSLGGRLTLTPDDTNALWLDLERSRQVYSNDDNRLGTRDGTDRSGNPDPGTASGYGDELRFQRDQVAIGHRGRFTAGTLESSLTRSTTETLGRTIPGDEIGQPYEGFPAIVVGDDRTLETTSTILDSKFVMPLGEHMVTLGGQWHEAELTDGLATEDFDQTSWALFVEDEWWLRNDLALTLGGRYEHHDAFGGNVSPRGYLVWNTTDHWTLKGGISRGYRTPSLNDLHPGINGVTGQGDTLTIGSPDLQPEKSTNYEVGALYDSLDGFSVNATLFYNQFDDKIASTEPTFISGRPGVPDGEYSQQINVDEARTQGLELSTRYQFAPAWSLSGGYTYTDTEITSGESQGLVLSNTPKHKLTTSLTWDVNERLTTTLEGEYYASRERFPGGLPDSGQNLALYEQVGNKLDGYALFNLRASYQAADNVRLTGTVYNLLDKDFGKADAYDHEGETYQAYRFTQTGRSTDGIYLDGRSLWLSASYEF
ncbi:outer membrane receptor for ferrienterochelin and colicins [Franzmannia pantelleriensis]|uniref:Outer membrane receptor for ferrienterochelin and colicins n=1 Tax=Franzmannia pantelleriensis TaxID=48727 RepID=A0A1G9U9P4_9GAMM|nr:TonB-dependent receptor [Halomonas pantelleriensis]SDM56687.1 outer membrane receptor for ferrienterochelin and colicins [Halomonas pantelleriensis]